MEDMKIPVLDPAHEDVYRNALHPKQSMASTSLEASVNEPKKLKRDDWEGDFCIAQIYMCYEL